jgi:hypothetical protein
LEGIAFLGNLMRVLFFRHDAPEPRMVGFAVFIGHCRSATRRLLRPTTQVVFVPPSGAVVGMVLLNKAVF